MKEVSKSNVHCSPMPGNDALNVPRCVADVMTRDTVTLGPERSFAEAVGLMATQFFHHILVVDEDDRLCGVISDRDVLRALARTPNWNAKKISEIMTEDSITTVPEAPLSSALGVMLDKRINCLPVIGSDGRVCGILTSTDLLKVYQNIQSVLEQR